LQTAQDLVFTSSAWMRKLYLLVALALAATGAHAEVVETLSYDYYDIKASPNQELGSLLNKATPFKERGRAFHAKTKWNIRWSFSVRDSESGICKIGGTNVSLETKITLPRLISDNAQQQRQFSRYFAALKHHELGHHQIAQDAAAAVRKNLASMRGNPSCSDLSKAANATAEQTVEGYNRKNQAYDVETDHGKSQGARIVS
jgi:predicted secreted Zn-dependent protease